MEPLERPADEIFGGGGPIEPGLEPAELRGGVYVQCGVSGVHDVFFGYLMI